MGYKKVCLDCRVSFNRKIDFGSDLKYLCPNCGKEMILLPHRFRPPKTTDVKSWEVVKFLIKNGFEYQHIYENIETKATGIKVYKNYVKYPENLNDAKEFVERYHEQTLKTNNDIV